MAPHKRHIVTIYMEGGGNPVTNAMCRRGCKRHFTALGLGGRLPEVIPCGSRSHAFERFCEAVNRGTPNKTPVLLIDSEQEPLSSDYDQPLNYFHRNNMPPLQGTTEEQYQLVVRCLETWLVADREACRRFFGEQNCTMSKLPRHSDLESISPAELVRALREATQRAKGNRYHKGRHAFEILGHVYPKLIGQALPWANRFQQTLLRIC